MSGGAVASLREVHRLRRHLKNLQDEIERVPLQIKAQHAKVKRQEELFREGQEAIKRLKVTTHEKEVTLKTTHSQIAKHQKQLNEAGAKKEYDALQAEIAADKQTCQRLEDEILTALAETEERAVQLPDLEKSVQKASQEAGEYEKKAQERLKSLQEQLQQAQRELQEVEATLPLDIRPQYNRVLSAKGEEALSLVRDRICTACHTSITAQNYYDLISGSFVTCKACGRILYLAE
jgi:predicted  nucleic acid-binding Zn-ribbon protein